MDAGKAQSPTRKSPMRDRILTAAVQLLDQGTADFSMRDLAAAAGVSFATPFNHFGSKLAIMQALSAQLIAAMLERHQALPAAANPVDRILRVTEIAAQVMLERPAVNRAIMAAIGSPAAEPGQVLANSRNLWADALGDAAGLADAAVAQAILPDQLALAFRGILSFWTAGEIADADLQIRARRAAATALLACAESGMRAELSAIATA